MRGYIWDSVNSYACVALGILYIITLEVLSLTSDTNIIANDYT